jgi:hypothetical protein
VCVVLNEIFNLVTAKNDVQSVLIFQNYSSGLHTVLSLRPLVEVLLLVVCLKYPLDVH